MALLEETFPVRVISHRGDMNWPPRSCDLTPLNFFLWSYAKNHFYANKPSTLEHLKTNIRQVMAAQYVSKSLSKITSKGLILATLRMWII